MAIRLIAATAAAAACALPFAATAHSEVGMFPLPEAPCNMPTAKSLIIWQHAPRQQNRALFVNEADLYNCRPMLDTWRAGQPAGPGYCSKIGWSAENPGYDIDGAPPLKKVIDEVGDC